MRWICFLACLLVITEAGFIQADQPALRDDQGVITQDRTVTYVCDETDTQEILQIDNHFIGIECSPPLTRYIRRLIAWIPFQIQLITSTMWQSTTPEVFLDGVESDIGTSFSLQSFEPSSCHCSHPAFWTFHGLLYG